MRAVTTFVLVLLGWSRAFAQAAPNWLEESLYGNGKINTVVAVVGIIIIGLGLWMFVMDRRLKKMGSRLDDNTTNSDKGQ